MSTHRQLAAILFTDIVGYTAMMQRDEQEAVQSAQHHQKILEACVGKHEGKVHQYYGDGSLSIFNSASEAVRCAIDMQQQFQQEPKLPLRVGIHLGEIRFEDGKVFGNGVNIASRLEGLGVAGSVVISDEVKNEIKNQSDISTQFMGIFQLKNVEKPVEVFVIKAEGLSTPELKQMQGKAELISAKGKLKEEQPAKRLMIRMLAVLGGIALLLAVLSNYFDPWKKERKIESIAVLPFDNFTGDPDQEGKIAGIHDNLISTLSQISSLRVISKTSTLKYKSKEKSIPEIASELGVDAIVESSVIKSGDSIRINVQLIQAFPKEKHLWAEIFDRPLANIFTLYNEVTQSIADEIDLILTSEEESMFSASQEVDPEAYKAFLKGKTYAEMLTPEGLEAALYHFERSLKIDSSFAPSYAGIAFVWIAKLQSYQASGSEAIPKIYSYNQKALDLDENYPESQYIKALMSGQAEWDWKKSEMAFLKAISINPNYALAHGHYSHILMFQMRFDEAIRVAEEAVGMDPINPGVLSLYAIVLWHAGKVEQAIDITLKIKELNPADGLADIISESAYYLQGDYQKSFELTSIIFEKDSLFSAVVKKNYEDNGYNSAMEKWARILEERFKVEQLNAFLIARYFNRAGKYDEALKWLEKAFDLHDVNMPYVFIFKEFQTLKSDPRYIALAKKINLPY